MFAKYEGIDDITLLSRYMLLVGKSMNSIPLRIHEWNFDEVSNMVNFRTNVRTKNMLSITYSKESCFIQIMFSIIKFTCLII